MERVVPGRLNQYESWNVDKVSRNLFYALFYTICTFALMVCTIPFSSSAAAQCVCHAKSTVAEEFKAASVVFTGTIIDIRTHPNRKNFREILFRPQKFYKGKEEILGDTILVYTPLSSSDLDGEQCGKQLLSRLDYIVFATGAPAFLKVNSCSNTILLDQGKQTATELEQLSGPQ